MFYQTMINIYYEARTIWVKSRNLIIKLFVNIDIVIITSPMFLCTHAV